VLPTTAVPKEVGRELLGFTLPFLTISSSCPDPVRWQLTLLQLVLTIAPMICSLFQSTLAQRVPQVARAMIVASFVSFVAVLSCDISM